MTIGMHCFLPNGHKKLLNFQMAVEKFIVFGKAPRYSITLLENDDHVTIPKALLPNGQVMLACSRMKPISLSVSSPAGSNSQSRRMQSRRSRAASGGHAAPKERADNLSLRRSISEMNLSTKRRRDRKGVLSMAAGEPAEGGQAEEPRLKAAEGAEGSSPTPASEEEALDASNLEQLSQCLIQPPTEHPYFLQLLGYNEKQVGPRFCWETAGVGETIWGLRWGLHVTPMSQTSIVLGKDLKTPC